MHDGSRPATSTPPDHPSTAAVLSALRRAVGLPDDAPDGTANESVLNLLDAEGWLLWCEVGLELFSVTGDLPMPTLSQFCRAADRVALELGEDRFGDNITAIAAALRTSRATVRHRRADLQRYQLAAPPMLRVRAEPAPKPEPRPLTETERMIESLRGR